MTYNVFSGTLNPTQSQSQRVVTTFTDWTTSTLPTNHIGNNYIGHKQNRL